MKWKIKLGGKKHDCNCNTFDDVPHLEAGGWAAELQDARNADEIHPWDSKRKRIGRRSPHNTDSEVLNSTFVAATFVIISKKWRTGFNRGSHKNSRPQGLVVWAPNYTRSKPRHTGDQSGMMTEWCGKNNELSWPGTSHFQPKIYPIYLIFSNLSD